MAAGGTPRPELTADLAERLARIALGHVEREYPHKLDQVLNGAGDLGSPRTLHPIFYGSFDWHSCVHGHWLLARILRAFPGGLAAQAIRALFDRQFTPARVQGELAYLARPMTDGFERPYGWAWLLTLQTELEHHAVAEGKPWADTLRPLASAFARRFETYLPKLSYPIRAGTHANTAFAALLALDFAEACGEEALARLIRERTMTWFGADAGCQAWEPSGDDFLSPALMEAECVRRVLPAADFEGWFARFLPNLANRMPASLFEEAVVSDPSDGKIAHLDGLNLSAAWCWRALAQTVARDDPRRTVMLDAADRRLGKSLGAVAGDYAGEHWLASFALLALTV